MKFDGLSLETGSPSWAAAVLNYAPGSHTGLFLSKQHYAITHARTGNITVTHTRSPCVLMQQRNGRIGNPWCKQAIEVACATGIRCSVFIFPFCSRAVYAPERKTIFLLDLFRRIPVSESALYNNRHTLSLMVLSGFSWNRVIEGDAVAR